jgi:hypothetical protein
MKIETRKRVAVLLLSLFAAVALYGCSKDGPAEELGEKVDETVQDAERKLEDAGD